MVATNTVHVPTTCLMMQRHARVRDSISCCLSILHACTLIRLGYSQNMMLQQRVGMRSKQCIQVSFGDQHHS